LIPTEESAHPFGWGSGVSAAKAEALVINTAANSKLETLIIGFSLSRLRRGNVSGEGLFQTKEASAEADAHRVCRHLKEAGALGIDPVKREHKSHQHREEDQPHKQPQ